MVFDNDYVTQDVVRWQIRHNPKRLDRILENTRGLIEAIVSSYDSSLREDMIQACYVKLIRACDLFNPNKGTTLHTYFTTVIHNSCRSVLKTENKHLELFNEDDEEEEIEDDKPSYEVEMEHIIAYCRKRFPLIDVNLLDSAIILLMNHISVYGMKQARQHCHRISRQINIDIRQLDLLYKVIIILLRYNHIEDVLFKLDSEGNVNTIPLMPELKYIFGDMNASILTIVFDGMNIRF